MKYMVNGKTYIVDPEVLKKNDAFVEKKEREIFGDQLYELLKKLKAYKDGNKS